MSQDSLVDDFSSVLSSNFDTTLKISAENQSKTPQSQNLLYSSQLMGNKYVFELIEELTRYRELLDNRIGTIVAEKTKTLPPLIEPMALDKQKVVIKTGILENAIKKLEDEIKDLQLENSELQQMFDALRSNGAEHTK